MFIKLQAVTHTCTILKPQPYNFVFIAIKAKYFCIIYKTDFTFVLLHQAETELQRASLDATRTSRQLEETIDNFEKQKIKDIKVSVLSFKHRTSNFLLHNRITVVTLWQD